jgi:hypothetical protein
MAKRAGKVAKVKSGPKKKTHTRAKKIASKKSAKKTAKKASKKAKPMKSAVTKNDLRPEPVVLPPPETDSWQPALDLFGSSLFGQKPKKEELPPGEAEKRKSPWAPDEGANQDDAEQSDDYAHDDVDDERTSGTGPRWETGEDE